MNTPPRLIAVAVLLLVGISGPARADEQEAPAPSAPRVVVLTDISSLTPGEAEPDDGQSLIRLLLHANDFDIEGLIATSNLGHGQRTRPDLIRRVVDAYEHDHPNLVRHDARYPPAARLRAVVHAGQPKAGPNVPVEACVGPGRETDGSRALIAVVDRPDPRPVWVLIWGGSADLAQALATVRATREEAAARAFRRQLRVHAIGDQDATGPWIRREFPDLFMITQRRAYRGLYRGGDAQLVDSAWVETHIHGHGALGDLYPNYRGGDIWSRTLGPVRGIKEGDTPSFLALVPNGLLGAERPELGSWGGRFAGDGAERTDQADLDRVVASDPDPRMSSVHRWRAAFQADFRARLDWCASPDRDRANHPPAVVLDGSVVRHVAPGASIRLDASSSVDPDGHALTYAWRVDHPGRATPPDVAIAAADTARPTIRIGPACAGLEVSILLTVSDDGTPPLTRYRRVVFRVGPG